VKNLFSQPKTVQRPGEGFNPISTGDKKAMSNKIMSEIKAEH
jgi:hypothetical protein